MSSYISELSDLCSKLNCSIHEEVPLKDYITFRFGGPCRALIKVNSAESVAEIVKFVESKNIKYGILGRGSNIIAADEGFDGVILMFGSDFANVKISENIIKCDSGALLMSACAHAQQAGLTGMENLYGIPGTVGGALYMNAGAYGSEMQDIVVSAECIDKNGRIMSIEKEDMNFAYRHSIFSEKSLIITSVTLKLEYGNPDEIKNAMAVCMDKRRTKQPLEFPSAGSIFKRPEGSYASLLIEKCGLKGLEYGGAKVSEKHSGFVINKGYATCTDVLELCRQIQSIVKEKTGFQLELEPVILK